MEKYSEPIRSEDDFNELINTVVLEAVEIFGADLTDREKGLLVALTRERGTTWMGRLVYLHQIVEVHDVTMNIRGVVNNILLSIRQQLNSSEIALVERGMMNKLLHDVNQRP
jgi:hypothetical protein